MLVDGEDLHKLLKRLFPINRSLTGKGTEETLRIFSEFLPGMTIRKVPSGASVYDWKIPKEWDITDAFIEDKHGNRIVDFKNNNLHVVGYSRPVEAWITKEALLEKVHYYPEQPSAIPYKTSYYSENWGFCVNKKQYDAIRNAEDSELFVKIDSSLKDGYLLYGDCIIEGDSKEEVLISTYVCHPSMANNELSGPVLAAGLYQFISQLPSRRYTYRFLFAPETIGVIAYLSQNLESLQKNVLCGFVLTCIGDEGLFSSVSTPYADTLADKVSSLGWGEKHNQKKYDYLARGSDERQYCSPLVNLPVVTLCRSKFGEFKEYHSSLDDLTFVTPEGLGQSFTYLKRCISILEYNYRYKAKVVCEPMLSKRGLYANLSSKDKSVYLKSDELLNVFAYANGRNDLCDIMSYTGLNADKAIDAIKTLLECGLIEKN